MACSWNPRTRNDKAHWENETSSCDDWLHISSQKHLLEVFVRETIKAEKPKPIEKSAQSSDIFKMHLASTLNGLVTTHLQPPLTLRDCHPKTATSHLTIASRTFSGGVCLRVDRTLASKMTDEVLKKAFEKMTVATYQMWANDIATGNYRVVKMEVDAPPIAPSSSTSSDGDLPLDLDPTQTQ
ncbi:hypothetical protein DFH28DRAFT_891593 [Melampsora americana]|nr:hypothetical protein DFH28DRAFT_891593 [Melampsora americana]